MAKDEDQVAERCAIIATAAAGLGDLDAALTAFDALPADLSARPRLAAALIEVIFRGGQVPGPARGRAVPGLLAAADADPPETAGWRRTRAAAEVFVIGHQAAGRRLSDPAAAFERLDELAAEFAGDAGVTGMIASGRMAVTVAVASTSGDVGAMSRVPGDIAAFLSKLPPGAAVRPEAELLTRMAGLMAAGRTGADVTGGLRELAGLAGTLAPDSPVRAAFDEASADLAAFAALADDDAERLSDGQLDELVARAVRAGLEPSDRAMSHMRAGMAAMHGGRETDPRRLALGVEQCRAAVEVSAPEDPQRAFYLTTLATALMGRHGVLGGTDDLRAAGDVLTQARELARGPDHPLWQQINEMLGHVGRQIDDRPGAYRGAIEGLRGTVWQVLVQPDLASAGAAVRHASSDALDVAGQCLAAGDPGAAITALDAGRGLALFAATFSALEAGALAVRLTAAGRPDLAERWRAAAATRDPGALSAALRRDVMTALARQDPALELLDPPGYAEIQQALTELDADALVYLMPGEGVRPGQAVLAPASGPPSFMALSELVPGSIPGLDQYLAALGGRDLAAPPGRTTDGLAAGLDEVGRWAWDAAMRPLIETYLPRLPKRGDRVPRVVLIPMGELARVPWQAARRPDGRYAIEFVALSQVASARMLVRSATLPAVPLTPTGLIVGDPGHPDASPLSAARLEAYAIRQTYYRGAAYLGRRPDGSGSRTGRGTAREVRDWLTSVDPLAGSVAHLACHGFVRSGSAHATAYLALAGGEEGDDRLTAEELVALLADAPDRAIALVVLAACRTGLSLSGYDEAYSLGTALLAGGVRTVLTSQWNVPDSATSALMFMVHRNLRLLGRPPWAALREAQLWMLDPDRVVPEEMPEPLREQIGRSNLAAVVAWAAFLHGGQ